MNAVDVMRVRVVPDFAQWRALARAVVSKKIPPELIDFYDPAFATTQKLFSENDDYSTELIQDVPDSKPHVPKRFLETAIIAACHRDPQRWNLLYRLLWRLQTERELMKVQVDADVNALLRLEQQVRRDEHKMHAFVRFRRVEDPDGVERFIAWYEPQHHILKLAAPFFAERFAVMRWTILTPDGSAFWDPPTKQLEYGPPVPREQAPSGDELEELWKSYYASIFNPARLNPVAMRGHMPMHYWGNLPEIELLPQLMSTAVKRVEGMVSAQAGKPSAAPFVPAKHTLTVIREALPTCKGCDLYQHAIQVVPGRGANHAPLMLVGEQPGDQEDLQGLPFVGPAGNVLRKALAEVGIADGDIFMTNAVKHFKFVQRGKLRLHQNPRMSEITACKPWLLAELDAVKPKLVLCLGASAAKSLLGGTFGLMRDRGKVLSTPFAEHVMATIHPSAVLRAPNDEMRHTLYEHLRNDLLAAYQFAMKAA
ncbi:UdgX family uracil-DNA binding protein [Terriglobus roseus]|uniref:Type-4 uracil-DNA glycosylase n=1 Tax=Terriglobus roseus TaxID=392734 RepID=A0A1G7J821_9BACT|nr:UdgX family uracil-DNA binding protein [Terriglobus roseus]SDF20649.1 DNA polymerase [Terriglobus roseus]